MLFTKDIQLLLEAAGTSIGEIVEKARANSAIEADTATRAIASAKEVIASAQEHMTFNQSRLANAQKVLKISQGL